MNAGRSTRLFLVVLFISTKTLGQDTLYINEQSSDWTKLSFYKSWRKEDTLIPVSNEPFSHGSFYREYMHPLYYSNDSTPFNGVIITQLKQAWSFITDYWLDVLEYRDGKYVSITEFGYKKGKANTKADATIYRDLGVTNPIYLKANPNYAERSNYYLCGFSATPKKSRYDFDSIGNTIYAQNWPDKKNYSEIYYFSNGQIWHETCESNLDSITARSLSVYYSENGAMLSESETITDESTQKWRQSEIRFNEAGDTIAFSNYIHGAFQGLMIYEFMNYDQQKDLIRIIWKDNRIIDVINTNVLYLDKKGRIIPEEVYLTGRSKQEIPDFLNLDGFSSPEYGLPLRINGQEYVCYASLMPQSRKLWKKVAKISAKYQVKP